MVYGLIGCGDFNNNDGHALPSLTLDHFTSKSI
jgi:hypothetical protein